VAIVLGPNQFGKAEVRLVHVDRSTPVHRLTDLNVSSALRGDFAAAHLTGDNAHILTTDAQKNTVYAFARDGVGEIEEFALRLGRHFTGSFDWITGARVEIEQYGWDRIPVDGAGHDHAFSRAGAERRTTIVTVDGADAHVVSGLAGLVVLKSTGSEFWGFARDRYTTLPETDDRILATDVRAEWDYGTLDVDWTPAWERARATLLEVFATLYSRSLQQTLYAIGEAILAGEPAIKEVRLSLPNNHHLHVDLGRFGVADQREVFHASAEPYGLIEGTIRR